MSPIPPGCSRLYSLSPLETEVVALPLSIQEKGRYEITYPACNSAKSTCKRSRGKRIKYSTAS